MTAGFRRFSRNRAEEKRITMDFSWLMQLSLDPFQNLNGFLKTIFIMGNGVMLLWIFSMLLRGGEALLDIVGELAGRILDMVGIREIEM